MPDVQAQKLCPSDPLVANELGVLAYRNHHYEAAASWLQKALDLVPGTLTASECLEISCLSGWWDGRGGWVGGAVECVSFLAHLSGSSREAVSRALFCLVLGAGARSWLTPLIARRTPAPADWEPTLINLGHALRKLRRWGEALVCYRRALGLVPGQPGTYTALGYTCHLMGDLDRAIENYHKVPLLLREMLGTG
jgi:tetratricopeptide (TPR) repeat protein